VAGGADPYNHFFLIGTAPPNRFKKVEVWEGDEYKALTQEEIEGLVEKIEAEKENLIFQEVRGSLCVGLKGGVTDSWLLDGGEGYRP
jgi:hypothetical protein